MASCDTCAYNVYDDEDECYYCEVDMDEDDAVRMSQGHYVPTTATAMNTQSYAIRCDSGVLNRYDKCTLGVFQMKPECFV